MSTSIKPLKILTVCQGNICRSPLAKFALQQHLDSVGLASEVDSAGIQALNGWGMDADAEWAANVHGIVTREHIAKSLSRELIGLQDVILTMTRRQRDAVTSSFPRAMRKIFTLRELEKLTEKYPGGLDPIVLSSRRASVVLLETDDVSDPYRRGRDEHHRVAAEIVAAAKQISRAVAPVN